MCGTQDLPQVSSPAVATPHAEHSVGHTAECPTRAVQDPCVHSGIIHCSSDLETA